jgi:hypothetical protein
MWSHGTRSERCGRVATESHAAIGAATDSDVGHLISEVTEGDQRREVDVGVRVDRAAARVGAVSALTMKPRITAACSRTSWAPLFDASLREDLSVDLAPPSGAFLVARQGEVVLGCAGLRLLLDRVGEVKRFFVTPAARGRGSAPALWAIWNALIVARSLSAAPGHTP